MMHEESGGDRTVSFFPNENSVQLPAVRFGNLYESAAMIPLAFADTNCAKGQSVVGPTTRLKFGNGRKMYAFLPLVPWAPSTRESVRRPSPLSVRVTQHIRLASRVKSLPSMPGSATCEGTKPRRCRSIRFDREGLAANFTLLGNHADVVVSFPRMSIGSGTTGVACLQTGRKFIGCEISAEYFTVAKKRIRAAAREAARAA